MFYALSIASLVAVILNFGTDTYLIRSTATNPHNSLIHLSRTLSIRFIAIVIGFVLLNIVVWLIQPALSPVMLLASAYDFLEEAGHPFLSFFLGRKQVVYRLFIIGGLKILTMPLIILIAIFSRALIPVLCGYVFISLLFIVACFWITSRNFGAIDLKWEPRVSAEILKAAFPFFLANTLNLMHMRFDTILVGAMLNVREVANYELGIKLVEAVRFMVRPFNMVFLPVFSEYFASHQIQKLRTRFLLLASIVFTAGIFLTILMNIFGASIITVFFGDDYHASILPTQILFISVPFLFAGIIANIVANAAHQEQKTVLVLLVAVLVNVGLNYISIPQLGIIGAAWTTVVSQIILTSGMFILVLPRLFIVSSDQQ